jgi:hypothetical protein
VLEHQPLEHAGDSWLSRTGYALGRHRTAVAAVLVVLVIGGAAAAVVGIRSQRTPTSGAAAATPKPPEVIPAPPTPAPGTTTPDAGARAAADQDPAQSARPPAGPALAGAFDPAPQPAERQPASRVTAAEQPSATAARRTSSPDSGIAPATPARRTGVNSSSADARGAGADRAGSSGQAAGVDATERPDGLAAAAVRSPELQQLADRLRTTVQQVENTRRSVDALRARLAAQNQSPRPEIGTAMAQVDAFVEQAKQDIAQRNTTAAEESLNRVSYTLKRVADAVGR